MFWTIGLTDSFVDSTKLDDENSIRNLTDILNDVIYSPNLVFVDDKNFKGIMKLKKKFIEDKICPEYIKTVMLFEELQKSIQIEKNQNSKKKCLSINFENEDDYEFIERLSEIEFIDSVIVNEQHNHFMDLKNNKFEVIKNKNSSGIKFSDLKQELNEHIRGIPKRDKHNINELNKIILDSFELNLVLFNFLDKVITKHQNIDDLNFKNDFLLGTILYLANIISDNEKKYEKQHKTEFNIITPMPDNRRYSDISVDEFKNIILKIFSKDDSALNDVKSKFNNNGNIFNIYIVKRVVKKPHKILHTRGLFSDYFNLSSELDEFVYFNGRKVTGVNDNLVFQYLPGWRLSEIMDVRNNSEISIKIKVF